MGGGASGWNMSLWTLGRNGLATGESAQLPTQVHLHPNEYSDRAAHGGALERDLHGLHQLDADSYRRVRSDGGVHTRHGDTRARSDQAAALRDSIQLPSAARERVVPSTVQLYASAVLRAVGERHHHRDRWTLAGRSPSWNPGCALSTRRTHEQTVL